MKLKTIKLYCQLLTQLQLADRRGFYYAVPATWNSDASYDRRVSVTV